jgi:hypothetical protein
MHRIKWFNLAKDQRAPREEGTSGRYTASPPTESDNPDELLRIYIERQKAIAKIRKSQASSKSQAVSSQI